MDKWTKKLTVPIWIGQSRVKKVHKTWIELALQLLQGPHQKTDDSRGVRCVCVRDHPGFLGLLEDRLHLQHSFRTTDRSLWWTVVGELGTLCRYATFTMKKDFAVRIKSKKAYQSRSLFLSALCWASESAAPCATAQLAHPPIRLLGLLYIFVFLFIWERDSRKVSHCVIRSHRKGHSRHPHWALSILLLSSFSAVRLANSSHLW